jgi:hypothetical protein
MLKGKILLVLALYIILGVIAFFNFGLRHYITEKPQWKITVRDDVREDLDGNKQNPQTEDVKDSPASPSDMAINN